MVSVELVQYPDVFLRSKSNEVKFPLDDRTQRLIPWMKKAMYQHNGIGLAAIQVGHQLKILKGVYLHQAKGVRLKDILESL